MFARPCSMLSQSVWIRRQWGRPKITMKQIIIIKLLILAINLYAVFRIVRFTQFCAYPTKNVMCGRSRTPHTNVGIIYVLVLMPLSNNFRAVVCTEKREKKIRQVFILFWSSPWQPPSHGEWNCSSTLTHAKHLTTNNRMANSFCATSRHPHHHRTHQYQTIEKQFKSIERQEQWKRQYTCGSTVTMEAAYISISCQMSTRLKPETFINREHHISAFRSFAGCFFFSRCFCFSIHLSNDLLVLCRTVTLCSAVWLWPKYCAHTFQLNSDYVQVYELSEETEIGGKWTGCRTIQIYF